MSVCPVSGDTIEYIDSNFSFFVCTQVRRDAALVGSRLDEPEKRSLRAAPILGQDSLFPPAMIQTAIKADREKKNDYLLYKNLG